jgi:hypothetical protein
LGVVDGGLHLGCVGKVLYMNLKNHQPL